MRTIRISSKENGIVLLLILGFMAMFAVMVLTFIMITSNLSESANSSVTGGSGAAGSSAVTSEISPEVDAKTALKTVLVGSNSETSPIGPFGMLENLYGEAGDLDNNNDPLEFTPENCLVGISPAQIQEDTTVRLLQVIFHYIYTSEGLYLDTTENENKKAGWDILTVGNNYYSPIIFDTDTTELASEKEQFQRRLFQNLCDESGTVLTFGKMDNVLSDVEAFWNETVAGTSATIIRKEIREDIDFSGNKNLFCAFTIQPNSALEAFLNLPGCQASMTIGACIDFIGIRLNRPAFAGTGAGGFAPQSTLDAQQSPGDANAFRLPFALWANAAAPDLTPFDSNGDYDVTTPDFRTFIKYIRDGNYKPFSYNSDMATRGISSWSPFFNEADSAWICNDYDATTTVSVPPSLNPSYTAPDMRSLFLGFFNKPPYSITGTNYPAETYTLCREVNEVNMAVSLPEQTYPNSIDSDYTKQTPGVKIIPSFHRPNLFGDFARKYLNRSGEEGTQNLLDLSPQVDLLSVLRKMTPRPLPLDHWNFSGGNSALPAPGQDDQDAMNADSGAINNQALYLSGWVDTDATTYYGRLQVPVTDFAANNDFADPTYKEGYLSWDVDNDGDGVREGIWIPSGLPIRTASDGTPYATFYSFTIQDMDGRVNINTAGSWDQMPYMNYNSSFSPYDSLPDLTDLMNPSLSDESGNSFPPGLTSLSPWYNVENLNDSFGWLNDAGDTDTTSLVRGSGFGPSEVNLLKALNTMGLNSATSGVDDIKTENVAANLLWNRNQTASEARQSNDSVALTDSGIWNFSNRFNLPQPGKYSAADTQTVDNSDAHRLYWNFTDGIYKGDLNSTDNAQVDLFTFPWRGKMRIAEYALRAIFYPTFDFNGLGLRSYDPLGNDLYTFSPKMSENPYLTDPLSASDTDTPYQASLLEALLRARDFDAASLDLSLAKDLSNDNSDLDVTDSNYNQNLLNSFFANPTVYDSARLNLTTISSDVPVPSQVFPLGPEIDGDGAYGIRDLIRRCVIMEFYKQNKPTDADRIDPTTATGIAALLLAAETDAKSIVRAKYNLDADDPLTSPAELGDEARRLAQALKTFVLYDDLAGVEIPAGASTFLTFNAGTDVCLFKEKIDALTDEIFSMLPEDTRNGRRLDLNALSRKASWLDMKYGVGTNVPAVGADINEQRAIHRHGLIERMKFARGLYVLLSALTWQERNAETVAEFYLADAPHDGITDYIEGVAAGEIEDLTNITDDDKKMAGELFANRLAQWCVNFIDFTDPDATMTPFYFDPDPFDGWWTVPSDSQPWMTDASNGTMPRLFTVSSTSNEYYADVYDAFDDILADPDTTSLSQPFVNLVNMVYRDDSASYAKNLSNLLKGVSAGTVPSDDMDFGFRRVWGMERPDLLLTETLSFHDLGVANTEYEKASEGKKVIPGGSDSDDHFDQVRRPQGSSYLELYCAANPNIPQSPELYDFDSAANLWKLDLSRMTPRIDGTRTPYTDKAFPVWRVAISASCNPRGEEHKNSALMRLVDSDAATFSLQTRQFCDDVDSIWDDLDTTTCVSHILGPSPAGNQNPDNEIKLDRIVWMTRPLKSDNKSWEAVAEYPDSTRLFWRIYEQPLEVTDDANADKSDQIKSYLFPNQYMVIGPEDERSIGSLRRNSTVDNADIVISPAPSSLGYFGLPSYAKILLNHSVRDSSDVVTSITPVMNPVNGKTMRVGTYAGITGTGQTISYRRGLNISEPLWTEGTDPYADTTNYPKAIPTTTVTFNGNKYLATKEFQDGDVSTVVPDVPFDLPNEWAPDASGDHTSPIAEEKLFGLGTVPGYRSAFVQRVADPNQPYHPLLNPYLTVDWNMMDLTVFNGEEIELTGNENATTFVLDTSRTQDYINSNNKLINLYPNSGENNPFTEDLAYDDADTTGGNTVFSSRQWGNPNQKMFYPQTLQTANRPNPWARPVDSSATAKAGLENAVAQNAIRKYNSVGNKMIPLDDPEKEAMVIPFAPKHTLGWYNDRGEETFIQQNDGPSDAGNDANWYDNLETLWFVNGLNAYSPYLGSPKGNDNGAGLFSAKPFEHLVWNDAPMSNPAELALIPASAPARFGLEFIRHAGGNGDDQTLSLGNLYRSNSGGQAGRSLGSSVTIDGSQSNTFGYGNGEAFYGPYLNFFNSVDESISYDEDNTTWASRLGESLNLAKVFDFVTIPSPYVGTQKPQSVWDSNSGQYVNRWNGYGGFTDEALYAPTLREPGKINVNTMRDPAWSGLLSDAQSGTFANFLAGRIPRSEDPSDPGLTVPDPDGGFVPFQPLLTSSLAATLADNPYGSLPVNATLWARSDLSADTDVTTSALLNAAPRGNIHAATDAIQKLSGLTTNRSNVFAVWMTIGYFKVERAIPGENMPLYDPEGGALPFDSNGYLNFSGTDVTARQKKYENYYKAIYPDGYTYGEELGSGGGMEGGVTRVRGFYLIDRSIPTDFRRGRSWNWENAILLQRLL